MKPEQRKMIVELDPQDWHGHGSESLWVQPLAGSSDKNVFVVQNSPFFCKGISYLDVVRAKPDATSSQCWFSELISAGGHSTYMVLVELVCPDFDEYWQRLEKLGCSYEGGVIDTSMGRRRICSIDVPPQADIYKVYSILEEAEQKGVWLFQEGHVGHPLSSKGSK